MRFFGLREGEREIIIAELAERMKDVVFMNAEAQSVRVFDDLPANTWRCPDNRLVIRYDFTFVVNDMIQILGHHRRGRKCKAKGGMK
jgi:hypothetical protein